MIRAWRLADGGYRLTHDRPEYVTMKAVTAPLVGSSAFDGERIVAEPELGPLGAEKVFGVITGPSSCGCEPAMFRWVAEAQATGDHWIRLRCGPCSDAARERDHLPISVYHHLEVIDVLGEADVALSVYEQEFKAKLEAIS